MTKEDFHRQHDEAYAQREAIWAQYATAAWDRIAALGDSARALTAKMAELERDYHAALAARAGIKA
jgi:hypothetical protein